MSCSHGLSVADDFVAVSTFVFLIVTPRDAEGDKAAAEPATNEAEYKTQNPCQSALLLIDVSVTSMSTELAGDTHGVFWPMGMWVGTVIVVGLVGFNDHNVLLTRHHRLAWGHHNWLSLIRSLLILHRLSRS